MLEEQLSFWWELLLIINETKIVEIKRINLLLSGGCNDAFSSIQRLSYITKLPWLYILLVIHFMLPVVSYLVYVLHTLSSLYVSGCPDVLTPSNFFFLYLICHTHNRASRQTAAIITLSLLLWFWSLCAADSGRKLQPVTEWWDEWMSWSGGLVLR